MTASPGLSCSGQATNLARAVVGAASCAPSVLPLRAQVTCLHPPSACSSGSAPLASAEPADKSWHQGLTAGYGCSPRLFKGAGPLASSGLVRKAVVRLPRRLTAVSPRKQAGIDRFRYSGAPPLPREQIHRAPTRRRMAFAGPGTHAPF